MAVHALCMTDKFSFIMLHGRMFYFTIAVLHSSIEDKGMKGRNWVGDEDVKGHIPAEFQRGSSIT